MSGWNPYAPDHNPPPGIPKGYPYALNPNPPAENPMCSQNQPMGYPSNPAYPSPYGTQSSFNPIQSPYPPTGPTQPPTSSPYPPSNSPYPPTSSPYPPPNSPYPPTSSPYPPNGSNYPPASSNYPPTGSNYPPTGSDYPPTGSNYPPPGSNYPPTGSNYPTPAPRHPPTGSMYPATGPSAYPTSIPRGHLPGNNTQNMAYYPTVEGTVKPYDAFNPKQDAEVLRKAMKGIGTNEKDIIAVLAKRSNTQRVSITVAFKQLYGKDLIDNLKSELSGNFEDVIVALMKPTNEYLASELKKAMAGIGTDEDVLIEILCSRTNKEIKEIKETYQRVYRKSLEEDIKSDTSGHFERLLVSLCNGARSEALADSNRAKATAKALYDAGVGQWGTDESVFNSIMAAESFQQLACIFNEYQKLYGHSVAKAIESEMSGDLKEAMLAIAKCVENKPAYFAEKLYKAMKGLGTDDKTLIRVVVSHCEIDMVQIKAEFAKKYGKSLSTTIQGDTSGDYRKVLIELVGRN